MNAPNVPSTLDELVQLVSLAQAGGAALGRHDVVGPLGALVAKLSAELEAKRLKDAGVASLDEERARRR
jgi:hypothetical protein